MLALDYDFKVSDPEVSSRNVSDFYVSMSVKSEGYVVTRMENNLNVWKIPYQSFCLWIDE